MRKKSNIIKSHPVDVWVVFNSSIKTHKYPSRIKKKRSRQNTTKKSHRTF
jgi:uncharacterized protein (DUF1697 family)